MNSYRWKNLSVGISADFESTVTDEMLDLFLTLSGDHNPLHCDEAYARSKGFHSRVVYGLLTASFYSKLVGVYLPGRFALLQSTDIQFLKPVFSGDLLKVFGKITFLNEAYKQIWIEANIQNQNQDIVSKAKIKSGLIDD